MIRNIGKVSKAFIICLFFSLFFSPHYVHLQGWSDIKVRSLPDSSFALIEVDKDGKKVRRLPFRDRNDNIDIDQLIYCLNSRLCLNKCEGMAPLKARPHSKKDRCLISGT